MTTLITTHLWQSTIVVAVAAMLAWLLRGNHARIRHLIWLAASVKFLLPFAALVALGERLSGLAGLSRTASPLPDSATAFIEAAAQPFGLAGFTPTPATAATGLFTTASSLPTLLIGLWLAGMLLVLSAWVSRWLSVKRLLRATTPLTDGREVDIMQYLTRHAAQRAIPLMASAGSMEPGIVGCFNPVILWPRHISARMNDEQIAAILLHELAHVRRRDNAVALLHMCVETLFWFHPLVWWVGAKLVEERERACDEEVVRLGVDPSQYAESILTTCEYAVESPLPCVAGVTGADLKRRITAIVRHRATRLGPAKLALLTSLVIVSAAGPIAAGALTRAPQPISRVAAVPAAGPIGQSRPLTSPPGSTAQRLTPRTPSKVRSQNSAAPAVANLRFEVASIRFLPEDRSEAAAPASVLNLAAAGNHFNHAGSIRVLIQQAYQIPFARQVGGPEWIREDNYRIAAKIPDGVERTPENLRAMLRSLLAERFKLVVRTEEQTIPVYVLMYARDDKKLGPSLSPADCPSQPPFSEECRPRMGLGRNAYGRNMPFERFAPMTENFLGRPIIDRTGITGPHSWEVGQFGPGGAALSAEMPSFFTAIQEQLGLKLESQRTPMPVVVIQSIERPTEN
jgi:bla regulator protein blaR1